MIASLAVTAGAWALLATLYPARPNVVVVVVDTLRRDHLATYGYSRNTAPFLHEMARRGVSLDGVSPSSWTKPAVASLLTGLHPVRHQAVDRTDRLPDEAVTLAERLRAEGYHTLAASANGWVAPVFGFAQGFDEFLLDERWNAHASELNQLLLPRVQTLKEPFFLYAHYVDPHAPYAPLGDWLGQPFAAPVSPVAVRDLHATHDFARPPELVRRAIDLYDGEIRGADDGLAALVRSLEARGVLGRTVVVVTSDHGEEFEEHGRMSHGQTLYEEVVRVPLVFTGPGLRQGLRLGQASLCDIVPTLVDLTTVPRWRRGPKSDGLSLARALRTGRMPRYPRGFLGHLDHPDGAALSFTFGARKLVLGKRPYRKEVFDLSADPGEHTSLLGSPAGETSLLGLGSAAATFYNDLSRRALRRSAAAADPDLVTRLEALGYVAAGASVEARTIPRRISTPDSLPGGRLGWEPRDRTSSCLELSDQATERLLLEGWYYIEGRGRWTAPTASLWLSPPATPPRSRVAIRGVNYRPASVQLRITWAGQTIADLVIPRGSFDLVQPVSTAGLPSEGLLTFATHPFLPAADGAADPRILGLFFEAVCLQ